MKLNSESVKFRDGSKLVVMEAAWAASIRLQDLENEARKAPLVDASDNIFNLYVYPKLAACSTGNVPTMKAALLMPSAELDKWYNAVKRVNPDWFVALQQAQDAVDKDGVEAEIAAKKGKKPTGSIAD